MPGWSPEIANEFISLARDCGRRLDQMQLQKLVYIAHGWCLASMEMPLTGDRPEAWSFGPVYRRLADALALFGRDPVEREIRYVDYEKRSFGSRIDLPAKAELTPFEMDTIAMVFEDYGPFSGRTLAAITQTGITPWARVFADGAGEFHDIPHQLIRAQFVEITKEAEKAEGI